MSIFNSIENSDSNKELNKNPEINETKENKEQDFEKTFLRNEGTELLEVLNCLNSEKRLDSAKGIKKATVAILSSLMIFGASEKAHSQEFDVDIESPASVEKIESLRKKNFYDFRDLVSSEKINEKLKQLKVKYGSMINDFLEVYFINDDLRFLESVEKKETETDTFVRHDNMQLATIGSFTSNAYEERWKDVEDYKVGTFTINGLEHVPDLSKDELENLLKKEYSDKYLNGSISGIEFIPSTKNHTENGYIAGDVVDFGIARMMNKDARAKVSIYDTPNGITKELFLDTLYHELNHPNDWNNSMILTSADRINLLHDITSQLSKENHFSTIYIDTINKETIGEHANTDLLPPNTTIEQVIDYIKATEYWAELGRAYKKNPEKLKNEFPEDYNLVKKWFKKMS